MKRLSTLLLCLPALFFTASMQANNGLSAEGPEPQTNELRVNAYGYAQLPVDLERQVQHYLFDTWQVGERPDPALDFNALPGAAMPAMDADFEKMRVLFFARALALGIQASIFRSAFQDVAGGNVLNYGGVETDVFLAFCLSYWMTNNWLLNGSLGYSQNSRINRITEDDRTSQRRRLATLAFGVGYYYNCFGSFGVLADFSLGFGIGSAANVSRLGGLSPLTISNSLWQLSAVGSMGVFYAVNRYLIFAQMGALNYTLASQAIDSEEPDSRFVTSDFALGLSLKQVLIGVQFLLNYGGQQGRYNQN
jgi:hypothetical protein